jgi:hypothetical protein
MTRPLRNALLACASYALFALPAATAPVDLDPPTLASPDPEASSLVHLDVIAGASGAPNGFTIEWMTQTQFDAIGGVWPADPADPSIKSAIYMGFPSLNTVDGTTTFMLSPNALADIEIGDIFDETGVQSANRTELSSGTIYVFRVKANGDEGDPTGGGGLLPTSGWSATHHASTKAPVSTTNCVYTQGYWKNHPSAWPVNSVKLGNVIYSKAQLLLIFDTPAAGNGLISLAHQLIAAKLNIAAGAIAPPLVLGAIATADALIGNLIVPPIGGGYLAPATTSHLTDDLEEFNSQEMTGSIRCQGTTPAKVHTWGELKSFYHR